MDKEYKEMWREMFFSKSLWRSVLALVVGMVIVLLLFCNNVISPSDTQRGWFHILWLVGWLSMALFIFCTGLFCAVGHLIIGFREGKLGHALLFSLVWLAGMAFAWFVMDIPGLVGEAVSLFFG